MFGQGQAYPHGVPPHKPTGQKKPPPWGTGTQEARIHTNDLIPEQLPKKKPKDSNDAKNWTEVLYALTTKAQETDPRIFKALDKANTWEEKVEKVSETPWIRRKITSWISEQCSESRYPKSGGQASKLRDEGNKNFVGGLTIDALKLYTQSVVCAPEIGPELALAFGNRSAALYRKDKYKECLADIELAFEHKFPKNLQYKLHQRRGQCFTKLARYTEAVPSFTAAIEALELVPKMDQEKKESFVRDTQALIIEAEKLPASSTPELMPPLEEEPPVLSDNSSLPGAASFLRLEKDATSSSRGRYVTAERNIPPGEVLFSEIPFASVQIPSDYSTHCHHCYGRFDYPIPCRKCTQPRYCSEKCRGESWTDYHRFECGGLDLLHSVGVAHLALRTLIRAGRRCIMQEVKPFINRKTFKLNSKIDYAHVVNLVEHSTETDPVDMFQYCITAVLLTVFLEQRTRFFSEKSDSGDVNASFAAMNMDTISVDEETTTFVASLLLKHILQLVCNASAIYEVGTAGQNQVIGDKDGGIAVPVDAVYETSQYRVATAIYPGASMMNHSCDPSVINSFKSNRIIVRAVREIQKGEEIFNCYGPDYRRMPFKERQEALHAQYRFTCKCDQCKTGGANDFAMKDRFQCLSCLDGAVEIDGGKEMLRCVQCQVQNDYTDQLQKQRTARCVLGMVEQEVDYDGFTDKEWVVGQLETVLRVRRELYHRNSPIIAETMDQVAKCYASMGQFEKSAEMLEKTYKHVESRFGSNSMEMCHEMIKLSDVYFSWLSALSSQEDAQKPLLRNVLSKARETLAGAADIIELHYGRWHPMYKDTENRLNSMPT